MGDRACIVSPLYPLISNLSVVQNVALIKEYHERWPRRKAEGFTYELLTRLGMAEIGPKRNPALTNAERFIALLLRAALMIGDVIVIDRPFIIMPDLYKADFIINALQGIEEFFNQCLILDYSWNDERYEGFGYEAPVR
ncbi:MAG TPA: hypothetical protein PLT64_07275 [Syntrophales bacterium]|nr:hypothetical protein [Syntrophales bacterium]HOL59653.1 hypothetical protein [Syntrophales bacterium]HPO35799.1 hypothetical protein [Syntrophales bacterium]